MKVIETVQSPGNAPVEIKWGSNMNALSVMQAVAQILNTDWSDLPEGHRPVTLAITITV